MARQRKPYTYTTQYGRRKIREESRRIKETMTQKEKDQANFLLFILLGTVAIFALLMYFGFNAILDAKYETK